MTDDERRTRQPFSMTRRYRRGLILTGLLCALAVLTAATVLFQRSYAERIDNYLMQIASDSLGITVEDLKGYSDGEL